MKAVTYVRVSTDEQATEGVSLEAQQAKLAAWANLNDAEIIGSYSDAGISGCREDRPGLTQAIAHACREGAVVVVYSLSRLSRSTTLTIKLADELAKNGADLVSITEKIDTTTAAPSPKPLKPPECVRGRSDLSPTVIAMALAEDPKDAP